MTDDVVVAARRALAASTDLTELLGSGKGFDTWIFPGNGEDSDVPVIFEGSKKACIVIWSSGGWAAPNLHNTAQFPAIYIDVYIDPGRDSKNQKTTPYLRDRFIPIWNEVDKVLNYPANAEILWDDMRIITSKRFNEWKVRPVSDTDGAYMSSVQYAVTI